MNRRQYSNPPIEEAICEFHFHPSQEWNLTVPGKLHAKLDDEYSGKPQEQRGVEVVLEPRKDGHASLKYGEGLARVQLVTKDGKRKVGVGQDVLSVHMLRPYNSPSGSPYGGWDEFKSRIRKAFDHYWDITRPKGVSGISVRYINKIVIPRTVAKVESYLKCALPDVSGLPDRVNSFMSRVDYAYEDGIRLVLSQGSIDASADRIEFLLDLEVVWENSELVARNEALKMVNELRDREREAFEDVITDETRDLLHAD